VPDLAGLTIAEAGAALQKEGLILGTQTPQASDDKPKDTIISQNPVKGGQVDKGSAVDVTVSTGKDQVVVPTLTGLTSVDAARAALVEVGLTLGRVSEKSSDKPQGVVISQTPASQETVDAGTPVDIVVSNGKVKVPDVVGSSEAQAQSDLRNAGFDVEVIQLETSNQPEGTVLAQSPQAGTTAVRGTLVTITVAKAPPPSPTPTPTPTDTPTPSPSPTP